MARNFAEIEQLSWCFDNSLHLSIYECEVTAGTSPLVLTAINALDDDAIAEVGTVVSLKRFVQHVKANHRPMEPASLELIDLQPPWTATGGGQLTLFLLYDELYPLLFKLIYVIRAKLDDGSISCVYSLLCGKAEAIYTQMLNKLVERCQNIGVVPAPQAVKVDFELAAMNSVQEVFCPLVDMNNCFYHLCQSMLRHIQDLGLVQQYKENDIIIQFVGMMDGLAFLPEHDLDNGVVVVRNALSNQDFFSLLQYFLETYIGVYVMNPQWRIGVETTVIS